MHVTQRGIGQNKVGSGAELIPAWAIKASEIPLFPNLANLEILENCSPLCVDSVHLLYSILASFHNPRTRRLAGSLHACKNNFTDAYYISQVAKLTVTFSGNQASPPTSHTGARLISIHHFRERKNFHKSGKASESLLLLLLTWQLSFVFFRCSPAGIPT